MAKKYLLIICFLSAKTFMCLISFSFSPAAAKNYADETRINFFVWKFDARRSKNGPIHFVIISAHWKLQHKFSNLFLN